MSGLDVMVVEDQITAYIKAQFPAYKVYDSDVLDDDAIIKMGNKVKPYIVLNWGGLKTGGSTSFAGARHDEYYSTVDVTLVAPTPRQAKVAMNVIVDRLIGWKPASGSPLRMSGGTSSFGMRDSNGVPTVYISSARLEYGVNTTNVGAYITP